MPTARWWKSFYARERDALGARGLDRLFDQAEALPVGAGSLVFPHTRLVARDGTPAALHAVAAALAVVRSGASEVLAVGVLHGAREADAELVARARAGDDDARGALRRVHGRGAPLDAGHADEEFSLDAFAALLEAAARREGRAAPRLIARYPFLTGADPETLPGFDELAGIAERGATLVATADMLHHGAGYGTPPEARMPLHDTATLRRARETVDALAASLARGSFAEHERLATGARSDFRDAGPVFAALARARGEVCARVGRVDLVDYADVLGADEPTWVAAALATVGRTAERIT